jgi:YD repeat-containing protein
MWRKPIWWVGYVALIALMFGGRVVYAIPFAGGIAVERLGDGTAAPTANGSPIFIEEYSRTTGALVNTLALPTTDPDAAGPQHRIVENGSSPNSGFMTRSVDGRYLVTGGYDAALGATLPGNTNVQNRIIARVEGSGAVDTSTGYSDDAGASANNANGTLRSVVTVDGTSFYASTANATANTVYVNAFGAIDSDTDSIGGPNGRAGAIFAGRFFISFSTSPNQLHEIKDTASNGLPTGPAVNNTDVAISLGTNNNPEQFVLLDLVPNVGFDGTGLDTLYMTNANAVSTTAVNPTGSENSGGLQKYTYDGSSFVEQITFNNGLALTTDTTNPLRGGLQGLAFAGFDASQHPIFYTTTVGTSPITQNALLKLVDTGSATDAFTVVTNSPTNTVFRGVALAPVTGVPGDYNNNGIVDSADYVLWRKGGPLQNEVDAPGTVNQADYTAWKARFGSTATSGFASSIPEPSALALAMLFLGWAGASPFFIRLLR